MKYYYHYAAERYSKGLLVGIASGLINRDRSICDKDEYPDFLECVSEKNGWSGDDVVVTSLSFLECAHD